jgi:rhodanese-related sulfurtransferase
MTIRGMAVPRITKEDLKRRLDDDTAVPPVVIDVRLKYPYEHSTITLPGAIRMAPGSPAPLTLQRDRDVVFYDSDPGELVGERAAAALQAAGYRASVLQGGVSEWVAAKLPTDSKPAPQPAAPPSGAAKA